MDSLKQLLLTTDGRIGRKQWWMGVLALVVLAIAATVVVALVSMGNPAIMAWGSLLVSLAMLWPSYCLGLKRRHDRDNAGRDLLVLIGLTLVLNIAQVLGIGLTTAVVNGVTVPVPETWMMVVQGLMFLFAIYMLVQLGFLRGTPGPNQYGPDPLGGGVAATA